MFEVHFRVLATAIRFSYPATQVPMTYDIQDENSLLENIYSSGFLLVLKWNSNIQTSKE